MRRTKRTPPQRPPEPTPEEGKIPPSDWEMFDVTEYLEAEIRIMSDRIVRFVAEPESAGGPK